MQKTIKEIFEREQIAIRNAKKIERILYPLVYPNEIEEIKIRLRLSKIHYRTEPVLDDVGKYVGRKVIIIE